MRWIFALVASLIVIPALASAQTPPMQGTTPVVAPGQPSPCVPKAAVTPPEQKLYHRLLRRLGPAQLTPQQEAQIQALVAQYSQAHPAGSPLDRPAMQQLRHSVMAILTPQQLAAVKQAREAARAQSSGGAAGAPHRCGPG